MRACIYTRTSTPDQKHSASRQINDLKKLEGFTVLRTFSENISGFSKTMLERPEFQKMLKYIKKEGIEVILVSELTRLGRKTPEVLQFIEHLEQERICLHIANLGITLGKDNEKDRIFNKLIITILSDIGRLESENLSYRIKSGIKHRKEVLRLPTGRQHNSKETREKFLSKHKDVIKYLELGRSYREITAITKASSTTIAKVKRVLAE